MFEDDFVFPNVGYVTVVAWRVVDIPSTNWQSYTVIPAGTGFGPPPKKTVKFLLFFFHRWNLKKKDPQYPLEKEILRLLSGI